MKIGLLVAGPVPDDLVNRFGTFGDMFKALLSKQDSEPDFCQL